MSFWNYLSTNEGKDVASEVILNVLRRNNNPVMGTSDIADAIDMSLQGAQNRLEELEDEGRVISQMVGNTLVWGLHPEERQEPVPPEIDRLVRVFDHVRGATEVTKFTGGVVLLVGFGLMFAGITGALVSTSINIVSNEWLMALGYSVAAAGGAAWFFGGCIIYGTIVTERFVEWRISQLDLIDEGSDSSQVPEETRGQIDARMIIVTFVLVVLAGPLLQIGAELRSSLAASSAYSPATALLISVLFIGAIVAAIFER